MDGIKKGTTQLCSIAGRCSAAAAFRTVIADTGHVRMRRRQRFDSVEKGVPVEAAIVFEIIGLRGPA